uniref:AP complex mu/sigma subunit domain-containing protein n=1 Tax=Equus asinus TaxID=9793 RepID=A0A8C4KP45_EQUAS
LFRKITSIIYYFYSGLYFCICVDVNDNNLAHLEAIHHFVEVLNKYFHNVCELGLVFNFYKVYTVVDEMFWATKIRKTSWLKVLKQPLMLQFLESRPEAHPQQPPPSGAHEEGILLGLGHKGGDCTPLPLRPNSWWRPSCVY